MEFPCPFPPVLVISCLDAGVLVERWCEVNCGLLESTYLLWTQPIRRKKRTK